MIDHFKLHAYIKTNFSTHLGRKKIHYSNILHCLSHTKAKPGKTAVCDLHGTYCKPADLHMRGLTYCMTLHILPT